MGFPVRGSGSGGGGGGGQIQVVPDERTLRGKRWELKDNNDILWDVVTGEGAGGCSCVGNNW